MNRWWRVRLDVPRPVEVEKFTESSVWVEGRRFGRRTDFDNYFPTYEGARTYIVETAQRRYDCRVRELESARKALAEANSLPETDGRA